MAYPPPCHPVPSTCSPDKGNTQLLPPQEMNMYVPGAFREQRGKAVPCNQAAAYSKGLPHQKLNDYRGCYTCNGPCGPLCCCYLVPCGENCIWALSCVLGLPTPWGCMICTCERYHNSFTMRGRYGEKVGELLFVDEERKTIGFWGTKCCSAELDTYPCCYFTKCGEAGKPR